MLGDRPQIGPADAVRELHLLVRGRAGLVGAVEPQQDVRERAELVHLESPEAVAPHHRMGAAGEVKRALGLARRDGDRRALPQQS